MSKSITPHNDKGQAHGYWELYFYDGTLMYKGNYVNGNRYGYCESNDYNGKLEYKAFYIK